LANENSDEKKNGEVVGLLKRGWPAKFLFLSFSADNFPTGMPQHGYFNESLKKCLDPWVTTWDITNFPYSNGYDEDPVDLKENKCLNSDCYFLA
jgi:hypothetical protein